MINFMKKNFGIFLTFFATLLTVICIFYVAEVFDGTILISDLNAEYQPLLMQVRRILTGQMGLLNFNTTLGDSFIGTFYYYMSSPLNILTLFIKDINLLVIILVLLKLSLASTFCYIFLRYQFKEEKIHILSIFSILYALSSFSLSYYFNIMWLDIYMLFPLLLLGIDKMLKERKHLLYIISLFLIIFCNYYFAYMVCIFAFIYFNFKLLSNKINIKFFIKKNFHFILVSFLTCICASIVLIPLVTEISSYSRQNGQIFGGETFNLSFNIVNFVKNLMIGSVENIDILNGSNYYLYTSIIIFPLLYFYFVNKKIGKREKILSGSILLLLVLSISCNYLNYIWHGFVPPSFFNGRFTFMFILFIIYICCKSLYNLEKFPIYHYVILLLLVLQPIILLALVDKVKLDIFDITRIILLLLFIILMYKSLNNKSQYTLLLCLLLFEICLNGVSYLFRYNFDSPTGNDDYKQSINYIKEQDDNIFYRIEDNNPDVENYTILYNYYGVDYFMSTVKKDLIDFLINMNVADHSYAKNTIAYNGNYTLLSSLLGIKYFIDFNNISNCDYEQINVVKNYIIYKNQYSLNLGYMVNSDIVNTKIVNNGLENINNIYKDMTGISVLNKVNLDKEDDNNYTFKNTEKDDFYVLINLKNWYSYSDLELYIDDIKIDNINNTFLYKINNKYKNKENISIRINANESTIEDIEGVYVYYIDQKEFEKSIDILKKNQLEVTSIKGDTINGTIDVEEDNILFTSIPYNKDIDVYVDNKKVDKIKLLNNFIGINLDKGQHEITIKYRPKTLYLSIIPSLLGALSLFGYLKLYKKKLANN